MSLVDVKRQWFKSRVGLEATETHRNFSFCNYVVLPETSDVFIVNDALTDPRFMFNPLVTGPPFIRFYAGAALYVNGYKIGSLCVIDSKPRDFSLHDSMTLLDIGGIVSQILSSDREEFLKRSYVTFKHQIESFYDIQQPVKQLHDNLIEAHHNIKDVDATNDLMKQAKHHGAVLSELMTMHGESDTKTVALLNEVMSSDLCGVSCEIQPFLADMQQLINKFISSEQVEWNISNDVLATQTCQTYPVLLNTVMLFAGAHIAQRSKSITITVRLESDRQVNKANCEILEASGCTVGNTMNDIVFEVCGTDYLDTTAPSLLNQKSVEKDTVGDQSMMRCFTEGLPQPQQARSLLDMIPVSPMLETVYGNCSLQQENNKLKLSFWVPFSQDGEEAPKKETKPTVNPVPIVSSTNQGSNILRVLIVDDSATNRERLASWLTELGCLVDTAENGRVGLIKLSLDVYNLVFVDFLMPIMNGLDMLKQFRAQPRHEEQSNLDTAIFVGLLSGGEGFGIRKDDKQKDAEALGMHFLAELPVDYDFVRSVVKRVRAKNQPSKSATASSDGSGDAISRNCTLESQASAIPEKKRRWVSILDIFSRGSVRISPES